MSSLQDCQSPWITHTHTPYVNIHSHTLYSHSYMDPQLIPILIYLYIYAHTPPLPGLCFALFACLHTYDCLQTDTGLYKVFASLGYRLCHVRCCYFPRPVVFLFVLVLCAFTVQLSPSLFILHCLLLDVFLLLVTANCFRRNVLIYTRAWDSMWWGWVLDAGGSQPWLAWVVGWASVGKRGW